MKHTKFLFIVILTLILTACTNSKSLSGNWQVTALYVNETAVPVITSNIKLSPTSTSSLFTAKGCAGVNLYNADITVKGKTFHASNMVNTGFMGTPFEMDFEDKFFQVLMNSNRYKIAGNMFVIYNEELDLKLELGK